MKWPWVSRATLEREVSDAIRDQDDRYRGIIGNSNALSEHNGALAQMLNAAADRYDALLDKYHALKLQGASIPAPVVVPERPKPDPVTQAILTKAKGNLALQKHYSTLVHALRAGGDSDEEIAKGILEGDSLADTGVPE